VYRAARVIEAFQKVFDVKTMPQRTYRVWNKDVEMGTLATITEIEARQGTNVIPGACVIVANCRLLPDCNDAEILRRMKKLVAMLPKGWIRWKTDRRILGHVCTDRDLIAACRQAVSDTGLRPSSDIVSGRTDTTIFQHEGGIQSVVMGPGTMGTAHTQNEFVETDSLVTGTRTVLRAVESLVCL
jgi:acetylornithine deacetylase/succinyl-diaminopimelate desuccinylase-like protein